MNVDEHTLNAIELISEGTKLTTQLLIYIFKKTSEILEKKNNEMILNGSTKEGKQKIQELMEKYNNEIEALEENITKEQYKEYQKEFKKLGVDFAVVKNGKDNYSFFFAAEQASIIEKALKNILERHEMIFENEQVKNAKIELDAAKEKLSENQLENLNKAYEKISKMTDKKELGEELKKFSQEEKTVLEKMQNLSKAEKEAKKQAEAILNNKFNYESEKIQSKEVAKSVLNERLSDLSDKELKLFIKKMEYECLADSPEHNEKAVAKAANEYIKMQKDFSIEEIQKVKQLEKDITSIHDDKKLTKNEILQETKRFVQDKNKSIEFSIDHVKRIHEKIITKQKEKAVEKEKHHQILR